LKQILNKLSKLTGFTTTEINVLLFVVLSFIAGAFGKYYKYKSNNRILQKFNYSKQDSLFLELNKKIDKKNINKKNVQKRVDSKPELLDFRIRKIDKKKNGHFLLAKNKININTAKINTLTRLPGIGLKTAKKIILLRKKKKKFNSIDELLEIKGIGKKKLNKIKKYLFLEN